MELWKFIDELYEGSRADKQRYLNHEHFCFKMTEFVGLTGPIKFDAFGLRRQFSMDLMELQQSGLVSFTKMIFTNKIL